MRSRKKSFLKIVRVRIADIKNRLKIIQDLNFISTWRFVYSICRLTIISRLGTDSSILAK